MSLDVWEAEGGNPGPVKMLPCPICQRDAQENDAYLLELFNWRGVPHLGCMVLVAHQMCGDLLRTVTHGTTSLGKGG